MEENINSKILIKIVKEGIDSKVGEIGNGILYKLCRDYPDHKNDDAINAKVWLIGRAYAAAIERRKEKDDINDDFYESKVIPIMRSSHIDDKLTKLSKYKSITDHNILEILQVHKFLLDKFQKISGMKKRSLSSKYLHFHLPNLFFIYDSRANTALKIILETEGLFVDDSFEKLFSKIKNQDIDEEYAKFFCRAYLVKKRLFDMVKEPISTRQFDNILIKIGNNRLRKQKLYN